MLRIFAKNRTFASNKWYDTYNNIILLPPTFQKERN